MVRDASTAEGIKEALSVAMDIAHGFHLFKDGDAWCAVGPDFLDLQLSPAGFGGTQAEAVKALHGRLRRGRLA